MARVRRSYRIRIYPNGAQRRLRDRWFGRQLTYKSDRRSKILIEVDRWYASSKTCSKCRHVLDELRLDQRPQKRFCGRCSQMKREAGNAIEPVWNRRDGISGAVK